MTIAPHYLLKDVREAGEFFEQLNPDGGGGGQQQQQDQQQEEVDPEWVAAVQETGQALTGVRGISAVTRGLSDDDERVVLVLTNPGLTNNTFDKLIPSQSRGFPTLVAIPFDALPLRRDRPLLGSSAPIP
jgi:hypothetical protein